MDVVLSMWIGLGEGKELPHQLSFYEYSTYMNEEAKARPAWRLRHPKPCAEIIPWPSFLFFFFSFSIL